MGIATLMFSFLGLANGQTPIVQSSSTVFPIKITSPGSYILKSNLTPPLNTNAIVVNANKTTIDLNGFSIAGSPTVPNVWAISAPGIGIIVKNGVLKGLCLGLGHNALVEDVVVFNCSSTDAIDVGSNSTVLQSQAFNGHGRGIACGAGPSQSGGNNCLFVDDTASGNPENGIICLGSGCNFTRNTANGNGVAALGSGLDCNGSACLFNGNVSNNNSRYGISAADHTSAMANNLLNGNGVAPFLAAASLGNNLCNGSVC
jgi:hypothetical protein